ncbi:MAG: hypothetical protein ACSLFN_09895 [Candidatus Limnocylindrales bacterium]
MTHVLEPRVAAFVAAAPEMDAAGRVDVAPIAERLAGADGRLLVATCHRVELYVDESRPLGTDEKLALERSGMRMLRGSAAASRLIELTVGLHSAVLAEDQLIHQVRTAAAGARRARSLGPDLDRLVDMALRAGRMGRSWRPTDGKSASPRSLADAALDRVDAVRGARGGGTILVVGSGSMGDVLVRAALARGLHPVVASRSSAHAQALADRHGRPAWPLDPGVRLATVEAVIVALGGPWQMSATTEVYLGRVPIVVDLSMPPSVPMSVRAALGAGLIDIDALARVTDDDGLRARYRERLTRLAMDTLDAYLSARVDRSRSIAGDLASRIERQRAAAVASYLAERPELSPAAQEHLDALTRMVAAQLFRVPLERLRSDPNGRRRQAAEDLFGS